jgi:hypothetical protein
MNMYEKQIAERGTSYLFIKSALMYLIFSHGLEQHNSTMVNNGADADMLDSQHGVNEIASTSDTSSDQQVRTTVPELSTTSTVPLTLRELEDLDLSTDEEGTDQEDDSNNDRSHQKKKQQPTQEELTKKEEGTCAFFSQNVSNLLLKLRCVHCLCIELEKWLSLAKCDNPHPPMTRPEIPWDHTNSSLVTNTVACFDGPREFTVLSIPDTVNQHHRTGIQFSVEANEAVPHKAIYNWWVASAAYVSRKDDTAYHRTPRVWISSCAIDHPDYKRGSLILVRVLESTCEKPIMGAVICNLEILKKFGAQGICCAFQIIKCQSMNVAKKFFANMRMDPMLCKKGRKRKRTKLKLQHHFPHPLQNLLVRRGKLLEAEGRKQTRLWI